jgi:hypothetical protein
VNLLLKPCQCACRIGSVYFGDDRVAFSPDRFARIISALLGVWNISISFNSITNVCRYHNQNEEHRRKLCDEKMAGIKKAVFSLMTWDQRDSFTNEENLFYAGIDAW